MVKRADYLKKLNSYKEKELIKVITGLRRSGKSILMDQFIDYLRERGTNNNQIIKINFEEKENEKYLDKDKLYKYINVGKVNDLEVDFVVKKENEIEYYQMSTSLYDEKTKEREIN